ncbi:addiction module antidote protein, HigA family [Marinobacter flavimaris]|uniref:Addiction module antidote protein, HigA family n=2 Tax=Marinobacter TaxID=2742 RepID=A0A3D8GY96_9GAMM|nr:addiction module antidote protein, HigA family [Marinobacter flavimaris]RDU39159.1 addiction module antidote protein, HigA family [Marinobacter flavimaris]
MVHSKKVVIGGTAIMNSAAPIHPGIHLGHEVERHELSKRQTAESLQIGRMTLYRLIKGEADITVDLALRLEAGFGVPAVKWLEMQADYDRWRNEKTGSDVSRIPRLVEPESKPQQELNMIF